MAFYKRHSYEYGSCTILWNNCQSGKESAGDTPSFLYTLFNGLRNYENPTYGGWGGRYTKLEGLANVYADAPDDGDIKKSISRWIDQANNDFQARLDWCVAGNFSDANHKPVIKIRGESSISARPGQKISLNAKSTTDPDGADETEAGR